MKLNILKVSIILDEIKELFKVKRIVQNKNKLQDR